MQDSKVNQLQSSKLKKVTELKNRPIHYDFSYKKPFPSSKTIDKLLNEGYVGIDYKLVNDNAFAAVAYKFRDCIRIFADGNLAYIFKVKTFITIR